MPHTRYELTDEHRARLPEWRDKWIANAMSTAPMTEADRAICRDAVQRLYTAAGLEPPPEHRIVFVASPFVLRFATGFAAWLWYCRRNGLDATEVATADATGDATWDATRAATAAATWDATRVATRVATWDATSTATRVATWDATRNATWDATEVATADATGDATWDATEVATWAATEAATRNATEAATRNATHPPRTETWFTFPDMSPLAHAIGVGEAGLQCAARAHALWQGGNQWSAADGFFSFFRHVAGLPLDYTAWDSWETLSLHSGPRCVHQDFCMISDRPEILTVDDANRPHNDTGPFCRWRDGSSLYAVHGVFVPRWIVERPDQITVARIEAEQNTEIQRVMIERFGWDRYAAECGAAVIDHDDRWGTLYVRQTAGGDVLFLRVVNGTPEPDGTFRQYILPVSSKCEPLPDPNDPDGRLGEPQERTALNAVASTYGMTGQEYAALKLRT